METLKDIFLFLGVLGLYLVLVTWVLPKLGIRT
jgi:hypothetical protein